MKKFLSVFLIVFAFIGLVACGGQGDKQSAQTGVENADGIVITENLEKAISENHLSIVGYGFSWQYAGMPSVFVQVTPTANLPSIAEKYGLTFIDTEPDKLFDIAKDYDGKGYIDKLPCKGQVCTLKALKDRLVKKVPSLRFNVYIRKDDGFSLMFFLPKAGMTWENTASMTKEDMLKYIADTLDVQCDNVKDNMGLLECRAGNVAISVGQELGSVIYGVK